MQASSEAEARNMIARSTPAPISKQSLGHETIIVELCPALQSWLSGDRCSSAGINSTLALCGRNQQDAKW